MKASSFFEGRGDFRSTLRFFSPPTFFLVLHERREKNGNEIIKRWKMGGESTTGIRGGLIGDFYPGHLSRNTWKIVSSLDEAFPLSQFSFCLQTAKTDVVYNSDSCFPSFQAARESRRRPFTTGMTLVSRTSITSQVSKTRSNPTSSPWR